MQSFTIQYLDFDGKRIAQDIAFLNSVDEAKKYADERRPVDTLFINIKESILCTYVAKKVGSSWFGV
ncbi:hypothetical protein [Vibrio sp. ER1A]|uniref:hypothetical protein n=1 Tax=Vibrio sp. ER1A TaxID=1517681 RepID=UPI0004DD4A16|nr:hypothetical protein [Vibrio sp. ER1A]KFA99604.1 hypothetical protein HW45_02770 [Vibrio sp. ER1A]